MWRVQALHLVNRSINTHHICLLRLCWTAAYLHPAQLLWSTASYAPAIKHISRSVSHQLLILICHSIRDTLTSWSVQPRVRITSRKRLRAVGSWVLVTSSWKYSCSVIRSSRSCVRSLRRDWIFRSRIGSSEVVMPNRFSYAVLPEHMIRSCAPQTVLYQCIISSQKL